MALEIDKNRCPQNHACPMIKVCPLGLITQEGHGLPKIDQDKCIECNKCSEYCPMGAVVRNNG